MPTPRVLIVDDDRFVRATLKDILEPLRLDVTEAADGREAVDQVKSHPWDLVLLDLFMPVKSGVEALMEIRKLGPSPRVLVISSLDSDMLVKQAIGAGANGFVLKPFHPVEITDAVKKQLRGAA